MKRHFLRGIVIALIVSVVAGTLPVTAAAAGEELVLTKIGHSLTDAVSISDASTRAVTLTVPYRYSSNTIDLNTGLIVEKASTIGTIITDFAAGSVATVGSPGTPGPAVVMTVKYYKGTDTTTLYTTAYSISLVRAAMKSSTFTGSISKTVSGVMPNAETRDITFSAADFTALYTANDSTALDAVSLEGSNLVCGTLIYNGATYTSGTPVALTDISKLYFDATATGSVSYIVRAYAAADLSTPIGSVLLNITVSSVTVPTITASVSKSVNKGSSVTFSGSDFTSCCSLNGGTLTNVEITPMNTGYGTWYNGSSALTGTTTFTAATIGNLKFTGSAVGSASFTWRISNEAGYSASGTGAVTVNSGTISVPYTTTQNTPKTFAAADFYTPFFSATGQPLSYIYFTSLPSSADGVLYYGYTSSSSPGTAVSAGNAYYYSGTPSLSSVTFVPASGFTGTVSIPFVARNAANTVSASGTVQITVGGGTVSVTYTTTQNTPKTFAAADFYTPFYSATGQPLSYIYFTSLPSSANGVLYYGYTSSSSPGTAVSAGNAYFYSGTPSLSSVTFVPASGFTGTVSIPFVARNAANTASASGTVQITVGNDTASITYTTMKNTPKTFSATDFNAACATATGSGLYYITVTPPLSTYGTLYYNYISATNPGTAVTSATNFYMSSSPYISYLTFVPASDFTGTSTIAYTGYNTSGIIFSGQVTVSVTGPVSNITYTTSKNKPVLFNAADFSSVCATATGSSLSYISLTLPSTSAGKLWYNYVSASNPGTAVTANTSYNAGSSPSISAVSFVPATNFTGSSSISYTAYTAGGQSYSGTVVITVNNIVGSAYFSDVGASYSWAAEEIDHLYTINVVNGTGNGLYSPAGIMTRGDFLLMLYRLTGFRSNATTNFSDVPKDSYYYDAIAAAKALGIAIGSNNTISPKSAVSRQDAMLWIYRALTVTGVTVPAGSSADIAGFSDKGNISSYALKAVEALVKAGVVEGTDEGKLNPTSGLSRAEMAVILYRAAKVFLNE